MLESLWRTHSCVPRSHSCERFGVPLARQLIGAVKHKSFKMFAHKDISKDLRCLAEGINFAQASQKGQLGVGRSACATSEPHGMSTA